MSSRSASTGSNLQRVWQKPVEPPTTCASAFLPVGSEFPHVGGSSPVSHRVPWQPSRFHPTRSSAPSERSRAASSPSTDTALLPTRRPSPGVRPCAGDALVSDCLQLFSCPRKALTDYIDLWTVAMVKLPLLWRKGVHSKKSQATNFKRQLLISTHKSFVAPAGNASQWKAVFCTCTRHLIPDHISPSPGAGGISRMAFAILAEMAATKELQDCGRGSRVQYTGCAALSSDTGALNLQSPPYNTFNQKPFMSVFSA